MKKPPKTYFLFYFKPVFGEIFKKINRMKFRIIASLIVVLGLVTSSYAQQAAFPCLTGSTPAEKELLHDRLLNNLATLRTNPTVQRDVQYVPIKFHLVAKNDGSGRVSESKIFDQLCELNTTYAIMNIQFYVQEFNYIDNTTMYESHSGTTFVMESQRDEYAMNIYVVQNATPSGDGLGTTLGYYSPSRDWVVVKNSEIGLTKKTLSHEIGHFFSLDHPFNGWDFEPYDPDVHGTPAPVSSPGGVPTEYVSGTNCTTAGDYVCDTPASYNEGFGWGNCNYTGGHMDPNGVEIDPDEKNMMDYFLDCNPDDYDFTDMQQQLIIQDLNSGTRNYLRSSYVPSYADISETVTMTYPIGGEVTSSYNYVNLQWNAVTGATHYLVEIARNATFTVQNQGFLVYGTNKELVNELESDKSYYWRVRPLTEAGTCASASSPASFRTGTTTATNNLNFVSSWAVSPNPVVKGSALNVFINSDKSIDAQVALYNLNGALVNITQREAINSGENTINVKVDHQLSSGVYMLQIHTSEGNLTKKIVVQ